MHAELPANLPPNLLAVLMRGASKPMRDTALEIEIEITVGHCIGGKLGDVYPGDRLTAPGQLELAEARAKVRDRLARLIDERLPALPVEPAATAVESRDPAIEHQNPLMTSAAVPPAADVQTSAKSPEELAAEKAADKKAADKKAAAKRAAAKKAADKKAADGAAK